VRSRALVGAAGGLAIATAASRAVGFGRVAVLARAVGTSCVGDTYTAANSVPNVVFEVVAGGALASLVVPVLASAVASGDGATSDRIASALLTWTVLILAPLAVVGMVIAPTLMRALVGSTPRCGQPMLEVGGRMLVVFMPQVVLYGIGVVLAGILQAHRRFLGPAIAPLLSSVVVSTAYVLYAAHGATSLAHISRTQELLLSVGTTLGVAVLSLSLLVPLRRCGVRLRVTVAFPAGVAGRIRRLAAAGIAGLAAQQLALVVALRLAAHGPEGSVVVFQVATALFLVPWAVLAVPVATTAFPELTARAAAGQEEEYADTARRGFVAVLAATFGGVALLIAVAAPAARLLGSGVPGPANVDQLSRATIAFAPGLVGYGLLALLARALYARGDSRTPALATVTAWVVVAAVDVLLVASTGLQRVTALGAGNTVGMTVGAVLLVIGIRRVAPAAVSGTSRAALAALCAAALAVAVAAVVPATSSSVARAAVVGVLLAAVAAVVYLTALRVLAPTAFRVLRDV
jgi:putative peptidoglycan lipid II flippase